MPRNGEFITTAEAAKALGVTQRWIQKLAKKGDLPSYRPGRRWLKIRRVEFEAYIARQKASMPDDSPAGTNGLIASPEPVSTNVINVAPQPNVAGTLMVDLAKFVN